MTTTQNRTPPHNIDAEASLLGALLLSRDAVVDVLDSPLTPEAFYRPAHQHVFHAIRTLANRGDAVDIVTVGDQLRKDGLLDDIGGAPLLQELQNATPAISNVARYASIVTDTHLLRQLIGASAEIAELGYNDNGDARTNLDHAEHVLHRLTHDQHTPSVAEAETLFTPWVERLQERVDNPNSTTGLTTGLTDLDRVTSGLHKGALYVIGARPAVGKSGLALTIATHVACEQRRPVLFVSLEMPHDELMSRVVAILGRIDSQNLKHGELSQRDWMRVVHAQQTLTGAPLLLDDDPAASVLSIRARARRVRSRYKDLALIVVDYLQLLGSPDTTKAENRQLEVSENARLLKLLARDLDVPVLATCQVNRATETRADKRPMLADLRESGAIEAHSDLVAGLYRDELYEPTSPDRGTAELNILKHRSGPTANLRLAFLSAQATFGNLATP